MKSKVFFDFWSVGVSYSTFATVLGILLYGYNLPSESSSGVSMVLVGFRV